MAKDRHRKGYYAAYTKKRVAKGLPADRHKPGYYHRYNKQHPERLKWLGMTQEYLDKAEEEYLMCDGVNPQGFVSISEDDF